MSGDMQELVGEQVEVDGVPLSVSTPDGPPAGGVIVLQDAFGVGAYVSGIAADFAAEGYIGVAPHLYHRSGASYVGSHNMEDVRPFREALTRDGLLADLDAAFGYLEAKGLPAERVGLVGFCMGGTVAFIGAAERSPGVAVTLYGSGILEGRFGEPPLVELAKSLNAPWLGLYGDQDHTISTEQVEALRAAVAEAPVPAEIVRYPYAGHAFHSPEHGDAYRPEAAQDAWRRTVCWLQQHLRPAQVRR